MYNHGQGLLTAYLGPGSVVQADNVVSASVYTLLRVHSDLVHYQPKCLKQHTSHSPHVHACCHALQACIVRLSCVAKDRQLDLKRCVAFRQARALSAKADRSVQVHATSAALLHDNMKCIWRLPLPMPLVAPHFHPHSNLAALARELSSKLIQQHCKGLVLHSAFKHQGACLVFRFNCRQVILMGKACITDLAQPSAVSGHQVGSSASQWYELVQVAMSICTCAQRSREAVFGTCSQRSSG